MRSSRICAAALIVAERAAVALQRVDGLQEQRERGVLIAPQLVHQPVHVLDARLAGFSEGAEGLRAAAEVFADRGQRRRNGFGGAMKRSVTSTSLRVFGW